AGRGTAIADVHGQRHHVLFTQQTLLPRSPYRCLPGEGGPLIAARNRHAEPPAPRPTAVDRGLRRVRRGCFDIEGKPVRRRASTTLVGASRNLSTSTPKTPSRRPFRQLRTMRSAPRS